MVTAAGYPPCPAVGLAPGAAGSRRGTSRPARRALLLGRCVVGQASRATPVSLHLPSDVSYRHPARRGHPVIASGPDRQQCCGSTSSLLSASAACGSCLSAEHGHHCAAAVRVGAIPGLQDLPPPDVRAGRAGHRGSADRAGPSSCRAPPAGVFDRRSRHTCRPSIGCKTTSWSVRAASSPRRCAPANPINSTAGSPPRTDAGRPRPIRRSRSCMTSISGRCPGPLADRTADRFRNGRR